jgi:dihydrofolate reductase
MRISLIVAAAENGVIGRLGELPWHISADLRRFKRTTVGHAIVMGRRTWDSIGSKPLPGRINIVMSRDPKFRAEGAVVVRDLEEALLACPKAQELFIAGGGEIYRLAMPRAQRVYLTRVHLEPEGDAHFPALDENWRLNWEEAHEPESEGGPAFTFQIWDRPRA